MTGFENIKERVELREKFRTETGHNWENSQGEPDVDYVLWLESKLIATPVVVGQSEQLKAFAQFLYNKEYLVRRSVDEAISEFANKCFISNIKERFSSEDEILQWLYTNTPFAIKPKSSRAKTLLVNPFTSNYAFEEVCKHLAKELYKNLNL